jgi:sterol desaturase/sphingolipid hydroxylase (fatty acid hydroxylase superfamily)
VLRASPPIFRNGMLDRLTRVHPGVPALIFGPAIAALVVSASVDMSTEALLIALLSGWAIWTLSEYWTHRVVFHFEPDGGLGARLHWMIHGVHHDHPNDPRRLVLPPVISVPFGAAFLGLFVLALGTPEGWAVCAGFYGGYLAYDMLHFALHHRRPRSRLGRLLYQLHMRHHFEDDRRGFGVSAPWWDVIFGTYARKADRHRRQGGAAESHRRP